MSRSSREQTYRPGRPARAKVPNVVNLLQREIKRRAVADGHIEDPAKQPPKFLWDWSIRDRSGEVAANTRSEARARLKTMLNIKSLPSYVTLNKRIITEEIVDASEPPTASALTFQQDAV